MVLQRWLRKEGYTDNLHEYSPQFHQCWNPDRILRHDGNDAHCSWNSSDKALPNLKFMRIAFLGDSRVRDIYSSLKSLLSGQPYERNSPHWDLEYRSGPPNNVILEFFWLPLPNENVTKLIRHWVSQRVSPTPATIVPNIIFYGTGAHFILASGHNGLRQFTVQLETLATQFKELSRVSHTVWIPILPILRTNPTPEKGSNQHRIDALAQRYGRRFVAVAKAHDLPLWDEAYRIAAARLEDFRDMRHLNVPLLQTLTCRLVNAINSNACQHG
ncbi:hypothetical protein BV898_14381 [Hypsibius exemplaris]|uniref:Uncharacterized protein n=1 Tax=Hypsibius exemplaris TaxID=2072580 RepID=A0A9X6N9R0_HYPEX|nr:hypothetical protein BV898_14381 [Hypsibius exemplaris]